MLNKSSQETTLVPFASSVGDGEYLVVDSLIMHGPTPLDLGKTDEDRSREPDGPDD
jgi:hypothetical protein